MFLKTPPEAMTMFQPWMCLIFLFCFQLFASAQVFDISRPSINGRDSFIMPPSMCGDDPLIRCRSFYATTQSSACSCLCPTSNATFTFANNRWMCMANTRARNHFQQGKCPNHVELTPSLLVLCQSIDSRNSKFHYSKSCKTIVPCESTTKEISFEWSHHRISSTESKVRITLYSIINSTTGKYCSVAFI